MLHVAYCADRNAKTGVLLSALSIIHQTKEQVRFHLILNGWSSSEIRYLEEQLCAYPGNPSIPLFSFYALPEKYKKRLYALKQSKFHKSNEVFVRLALPELVMDVENLLYLDADTLVYSDISRLCNTNIYSYPFGAVTEKKSPLEVMDSGIYKSNGFGFSDHIFNTGVLLLNIPEWKRLKLTEKVLAYIEGSPQEHSCAVQTPMNIVLKDSYYLLDFRWNCDARSKLTTDWKILHYIGVPKPWNILGLRFCKHAHLWLQLYNLLMPKPWNPFEHLTEWKFLFKEWTLYKKLVSKGAKK